MTDKKPSSIGEAPSLADISSAEDRVGKVDFTAQLGDRRSEAEEAARTGRGDATVPLTSMVRPQRPARDGREGADGPRMPFILPPAKVDAAMTAEAERTRLEIAAARGELAEDDAPEDLDDLDDADHADHADDQDGPAAEDEGADGAHLETDHEPDREPRSETRPGAVEPPHAPTAATGRAGLGAPAEREPATLDDSPLGSVDRVATEVIAAMRRINEAHERHVESLELETARRCELLTAQAELDAELIRLHARREAHAIISAAHERTGERDVELVGTDQLGEIGETFSRFAETIETTVNPGPASPGHLWST